MNIVDIIDKKRLKQEVSYDELNNMVDGYIHGTVKDYQMSAFLMAICLNDMTDQEILNLTEIFIKSGDRIDLSDVKGIKVDKHSTGGVGDKITLILGPLVASCGVKVAKMSGRGLGHTGGTIDKLESIPGFNVNLTKEEFERQVNEIDIALVSQTGNLVPADKKIYALRDVTATVSSIPLIASSIMSKKIASGADKIVIDLKMGNGALVKNIEEARRLANLMIMIGKHYNKEVVCIVTNMNRPLGRAIGNTLEVLESIEVLNREGPSDVRKLVIAIGTYMVSMGLNISLEESQKIVINNLDDKKAMDKFKELVVAQGGNLEKMTLASKAIPIRSPKTGYINNIDALKLGELARSIGAGRLTKEDRIDYGVGFVLSKQVGEFIRDGEQLLTAYVNEKDLNIKDIIDCFEISSILTNKEPLIHEIIR